MTFDFIDTPEYDFLRTHKYLGENILFLTLGGSHAYGTNVESSDIDLRGVTAQPKETLLGLQNFEQATDNTTDTVIYSFNRIISLLMNSNPNVIEMLGCKAEHYTMVSPLGQRLLDNKHLFISQKAINAFGGYANQQLRRLQNAIARDTLPQAQKEEHILNSIEFMRTSFNDRFQELPEGAVHLFIDTSEKEDMDAEIFMDVSLKHYPLRDYKGMWSEFNNIVKEYGKLNARNNKKDDAHLNKHAMHLIRLYYMCLDILEKGEINTYRPEREFLLSIRNGVFQNEDSSYKSEFFEVLNDLEKRLQYAKENTAVQKLPNHKEIEKFMVEVNYATVTGGHL